MKTQILLILVFTAIFSQAAINPDSLKQVAFKPIMDRYIEKLSQLSRTIHQTNNPDSIRFLAKKIMRISDDMEKTANDFYCYQSSKTQFASLFVFSGKNVAMHYAFITMPGGKQPYVTAKVNRIYDCATNIRFLWSKNPGKIQKNLDEIKELQEDLLALN